MEPEPERLEKNTRGRSRLEKKSEAGAAKKFFGSPALRKNFLFTCIYDDVENAPENCVYGTRDLDSKEQKSTGPAYLTKYLKNKKKKSPKQEKKKKISGFW